MVNFSSAEACATVFIAKNHLIPTSPTIIPQLYVFPIIDFNDSAFVITKPFFSRSFWFRVWTEHHHVVTFMEPFNFHNHNIDWFFIREGKLWCIWNGLNAFLLSSMSSQHLGFYFSNFNLKFDPKYMNLSIDMSLYKRNNKKHPVYLVPEAKIHIFQDIPRLHVTF